MRGVWWRCIYIDCERSVMRYTQNSPEMTFLKLRNLNSGQGNPQMIKIKWKPVFKRTLKTFWKRFYKTFSFRHKTTFWKRFHWLLLPGYTCIWFILHELQKIICNVQCEMTTLHPKDKKARTGHWISSTFFIIAYATQKTTVSPTIGPARLSYHHTRTAQCLFISEQDLATLPKSRNCSAPLW